MSETEIERRRATGTLNTSAVIEKTIALLSSNPALLNDSNVSGSRIDSFAI